MGYIIEQTASVANGGFVYAKVALQMGNNRLYTKGETGVIQLSNGAGDTLNPLKVVRIQDDGAGLAINGGSYFNMRSSADIGMIINQDNSGQDIFFVRDYDRDLLYVQGGTINTAGCASLPRYTNAGIVALGNPAIITKGYADNNYAPGIHEDWKPITTFLNGWVSYDNVPIA